MGDAFEERKRKHEEKWAHDEALRFKVAARRNKLLGVWAAGKLGLSGPAAGAYTAAVVKAELSGGADGVVHKLIADFEAAALGPDAQTIRNKMSEFETLAAQQVLGNR